MDTVAGSVSGVVSRDRGRWRDRVWWPVVVGVSAVAAGVVAVWVTLPADFLRYPAWLSAQKADFVIGPALTGLYWMRKRPASPFGPMLICWGVVGALYILQSSSDSTHRKKPCKTEVSTRRCDDPVRRSSAVFVQGLHSICIRRALRPHDDLTDKRRGIASARRARALACVIDPPAARRAVDELRTWTLSHTHSLLLTVSLVAGASAPIGSANPAAPEAL